MPSYLPVRRLLDIARRFGWNALRFIEPMPDDLLFSADQTSEVALTPHEGNGANEGVRSHHVYKRIQPRLLNRKPENCHVLQAGYAYDPGAMTEQEAKSFGALVTAARRATIVNGRSLSQGGLAERLGKRLKEDKIVDISAPTQQTISHIEIGKTKDSRYSTYLVKILNIPVEKLPQSLRATLSNRNGMSQSVHSKIGGGAWGTPMFESVAGKMDHNDWLALERQVTKYGTSLLLRAVLEIESRLEAEAANP